MLVNISILIFFRICDLTLTCFLSKACTVCCLFLHNSCNRIQMKITVYCLLLRSGWRGSPRGKSKCSHFEFDRFSEHCLFDIQSLQELDSVQHSVLHSSISSKSFPGIVKTNIILERMNWKYFIITTTDLTFCQSEIFFRLPLKVGGLKDHKLLPWSYSREIVIWRNCYFRITSECDSVTDLHSVC